MSMYRLRRHIRFAINPPGTSTEPGLNGYAGNPPVRGLGRFYELVVDCRAALGEATQYVINIKDIDRAFRTQVLPELGAAIQEDPLREPASLVPLVLGRLDAALPGIVDSVLWRVSPYYGVAMNRDEPRVVLLRQKFDFCAAHRLNNPALSPAQNVALFGKCNSPSGHGHNYQFEPVIAMPLDAGPGPRFSLVALERLAEDEIIARFDHKNLNSDTAEFRDGSGVIPTCEQISRVCFELLDSAMKRERFDATLRSVTVWESDRTSSTYPG